VSLSKESVAALESLRDVAPAKSSWTDATRGVWAGGRLYINEFGEPIFVPLGKSRSDLGVVGPLHFIGDALTNVKGWGSVHGHPEIELVVPVEGAA
jgi:hypothetical protein